MNEPTQPQSLSDERNAFVTFLQQNEEMTIASENLSKRDVGKAFYRLAKIHYDKSDLAQAEECFLKALSGAERPRDNFSLLKILGFLIRIASERMDSEKAQTYIAKTETIIDELQGVLGSLNAEYFYNVGIAHNYRGNFIEAKENFNLALKKSREENEPDLQAKCLLALATNHFGLKKYDDALEYLNQLSQLLNIIQKSYLKGSMYLFSGKIYSELGMYDNALKYFEQSSLILQQKKCWNLYGYVLMGRGTVYKRMGQFDKALTFFKLALEAIDQTNFKRLTKLIQSEIQDVNDSSIDLYLDRTNRKVHEKNLGTIDFKHRFVLLEILFLLAKNSGTYFDKEQLAKSIWKDEYNPLIHDKLIYTSVSRLRKLIEPKNSRGEKRKYIIRGKDGYTFNPHVKLRFHMEGRMEQADSIANVELSSPV